MPMDQKSKSLLNLAIILAGVIIVLGLALKITRLGSEDANIETPTSDEVTVNSICGLTVSEPTPNEEVVFPLTVNAVVDNTLSGALGCSWTVFEAQAALIEVMDSDNNKVGQGLLTTNEDWMTTGPVNFTSVISLDDGVSSGEELTLIFNEEDPSDGEAGVPSVLEIPVVAQ